MDDFLSLDAVSAAATRPQEWLAALLASAPDVGHLPTTALLPAAAAAATTCSPPSAALAPSQTYSTHQHEPMRGMEAWAHALRWSVHASVGLASVLSRYFSGPHNEDGAARTIHPPAVTMRVAGRNGELVHDTRASLASAPHAEGAGLGGVSGCDTTPQPFLHRHAADAAYAAADRTAGTALHVGSPAHTLNEESEYAETLPQADEGSHAPGTHNGAVSDDSSGGMTAHGRRATAPSASHAVGADSCVGGVGAKRTSRPGDMLLVRLSLRLVLLCAR